MRQATFHQQFFKTLRVSAKFESQRILDTGRHSSLS